MKRLLCPAGVFAALLAAVSCSRSEPVIKYGFIELVYYEGDARPDERFSFFVLPDNKDGIEDLGDLCLYFDRESLRWTVKPEEWVRYEEEGKTWIGSRAITMRDGESLPRGQYRAVLTNKGGETSERAFTFDAPSDPKYPLPYFSVREGNYNIDSKYPENKFLCYDGDGKFVQEVLLTAKSGKTADLHLPGNVKTLALWAKDSDIHCSALTKPASLR
ncbi:MAG: hypothetical protein LBR16_06670 [Treponema sp.]|jgi:hypothetical protein|nr:hypothetical protein [Treponema sp.]